MDLSRRLLSIRVVQLLTIGCLVQFLLPGLVQAYAPKAMGPVTIDIIAVNAGNAGSPMTLQVQLHARVDLPALTLSLSSHDQRLQLSAGSLPWQGDLKAGQDYQIELQFNSQAERQTLLGAELVRVDLHANRNGVAHWLGAASYALATDSVEAGPSRVAEQDSDSATTTYSNAGATRYFAEYSLD